MRELREQIEGLLTQNDCNTEVRVSYPDGSSYITTAHATMIDDIMQLIAEAEQQARKEAENDFAQSIDIKLNKILEVLAELSGTPSTTDIGKEKE